MCVMVMVAITVVAMIVVSMQKPGAEQVDTKPKHRDRDRFTEMNGDRLNKPQRRFVADAQRDHQQNDGAAEGRKLAELAGAERKTRIVGMAAREQIGEPGDGQRRNMGSHVPTVGDECNGTE